MESAQGMGRVFSFTKAQQHKTSAATPLPSQEPCQRTRDWTNQELSDVYRALSCLGQAGILVDIDRGLSDEGEPWMVLCRGDGEVFIHFCRLDGRYLLDSPALARPLRGENFAELIDRFIAQAARAAAPNVVAFRASKVFLHPAALLTILVWSLYVWSSDNSEVQAGELRLGDPLPTPALSAAEKLIDENSAAPATGSKPGVVTDGASADKWIARLLQAVDYSGGVPAGNNIAAMHMLAVMGTLMLTGLSTHALDSGAGSAGAVALGDVLLGTAADDRPADFVDFRETLAQSAWEGSHSADALIAAAGPAAEAGIVEPVQDQPHIGAVAQLHIAQPLSQGQPASASAVAPELVLSDENPVLADAIVPTSTPGDGIEVQTAALAGEFAALLSSSFSLARYDVDGVSLLASFDPGDMPGLQIAGGTSEAGVVDLRFEAPQLDPAPPAAQDGVYGEAARAFINSFLQQADDIQIMASANELVLIDLSAFDDAMDHAFAYSWSLEDGGTISTLGHYDFFASYALV